LATPLVNELMLPMTLFEKFCTPPTTEAANVAPGNDEDRPPPVGRDAGALPVIVGAERYIGS
jgi:hypothetical protein